MRWATPDEWVPADGLELEPTAMEVVAKPGSFLVVAGPGAGKTELLAQKASFLLQTNTCIEPRRILAISFKRDAADNIRLRVQKRCGHELSLRFESHTFDSFAKGLVERFRQGLPTKLRPSADFAPATAPEYADLFGSCQKELVARPECPDQRLVGAYKPKEFLEREVCRLSLAALAQDRSVRGWTAAHAWLWLLKQDPSRLTFDMIKRLAQHLMILNPLLQIALSTTYSHVFLDEYQDTALIQYEMLRTCFPTSATELTAVGDDKQRIMVWAGAMENGFDAFIDDYGARKLQLLMNYRSDQYLVDIQSHLIAALDPECKPGLCVPANRIGDGVCRVLLFDDDAAERQTLCQMISESLHAGVSPREISIMARARIPEYVDALIGDLSEVGIRCRIEDDYQELLEDPLVSLLLDLLHLAAEPTGEAERYHRVLDVTSSLRMVQETDEEGALRAEEELNQFIETLRERLTPETADQDGADAVIGCMIEFLGVAAIRSHFPKHSNASSFERDISKLRILLAHNLGISDDWRSGLLALEGVDAIPAMTIHKSKGLEYHTVIFIGLEDDPWWSFRKEPHQETCAFFVAFSRAKKRVFFTFCDARQGKGTQRRQNVSSLYSLLEQAGVEIVRADPLEL